MSGFPKATRPASAKILDAWIRDRARAEGQVAQRIRLGIGYMVVSAVLGAHQHDRGCLWSEGVEGVEQRTPSVDVDLVRLARHLRSQPSTR